jgi:hypothetical protein
MGNDKKRGDVNGLFLDLKVDPEEIPVFADNDGTVTLRAIAGKFRQKIEVRRAADRVLGAQHMKGKVRT